MVLLDQVWDDVLAGPQPGRGLGKLRKDSNISGKPLKFKGGEDGDPYQRSFSMPTSHPGTPTTPGTPANMSPTAARKDNCWRSVFNPGSNSATKSLGGQMFDQPNPNSPTVYDWMYRGESRSKHHP
ncbi:hypothetical protein Leryth_018385 [Lithospermum erythrorhizon]|uniref:Auxin-repressed protein n=1 Tax=Lithospermum erythrorhizon TaxID=34254 RepID=A0AAV3PG02_LITER|nr:hypothetical protein Leryth_018385 [Lithospermum erythrorhizon]